MENKSRKVPRRTLIKSVGAAAGVVIGFPRISTNVLAAAGRTSANERLTMAHIGVGGMGGNHLRDMVNRMKKGEVNIAAVCDVDEKRLIRASEMAGPQADVYHDYRYVLERKDIDAVVISTPDHWHGVQTVHAA